MKPVMLDKAAPSAPLLTPAEYDACVREIESLREIRDRDLPDLLRDARTFVASDAEDEILQIIEDQAVVDARLRLLEELLREARVVSDDAPSDVVCLNRLVEVEYLRSGTVVRYRIVGSFRSAERDVVSASSPIGSTLMGHSPGDILEVRLPSGRIEDLRILAVSACKTAS
jgi:transcription elongation factor GreA